MFLHKNVGFFSQLPILYFQQVTVIPTISFYQNDPYLNYVVLNINGDTALSGNNNTFLDSGFRNITPNSFVTQGTVSPFSPAGWSGYFNGSSYFNLTAGGITDFGANPYTFECYLWLGSTGTIQTIYDGRNTGADAPNTNFTLSINASAKVVLVTNQANLITTTQGLISGSWNHIAVCRTTTGINGASVYINGVGQTFTNATTYTNPRSTIGASSTTLGSAPLINSYISNLRVVKGTALYTANFTPNSAEHLKLLPNTSLLTLQDNRFVDNSRNNFTLSATGTPQTQPFSPIAPAVDYTPSLHGGSVYFNGSSYLSIASNSELAFPSGTDFTIETWINFSSFTNNRFYSTTNLGAILYFPNGVAKFGTYAGSDILTSDVTLVTNTWYHVAITRSGTVLRMFINGVQAAIENNDTTTFEQNTLRIGADFNSPTPAYTTGYASELRVVKGQAVYTSNFTPPTSPLTSTTNGGALYGTSLVPNLSVTPSLLLNFNNGGIIDRSYKNNIIVINDSKTQTSSSKFGNGSLYFDGTGDYLEIPSNQNLALSGDFTIEFWMNPSAIAGGIFRRILTNTSGQGTVSGDWWVRTQGTGVINAVGGVTGTTVLSINTWYHIAVTRTSGVIKLFVNGTKEGTDVTNRVTYSPIRFIGGWYSNVNPEHHNGYLEDIRITNGISRYTANFTPPPKLQANKSDPYYSNVVLFLDGNNIGSNVNNEFRATVGDATRLAITRTSNVTQGSFSPFSPNGWSGFFDGSSYLSTPWNTSLALSSNDFNIECYMYPITGGYICGIWNDTSATTQSWILTTTTNGISFIITVGGTLNYIFNNVTTTPILSNTWQHISITRSSNTWYYFLNGNLISTATNSGTIQNGSDPFTIGRRDRPVNTSFYGYISNLRIIKGKALYTSAFTPPTGPLPALSGSGFSTSLLTLQNNRFKDNSANNFTLSIGAGTPRVQSFNPFKQSTAYSPTLHGGSGYFDGASYISTPDNAAFKFRSGSFTIECWVFGAPVCDALISKWNVAGTANTNQWLLYFPTANTPTFTFSTDGSAIAGTVVGPTLTSNTWNHIAVVRNGNTFRVYVNGVAGTAVTNSNSLFATETRNLGIGFRPNSASTYYTGYVSNIRIVKGQALYTSNFTPPTSPVTAVNGTSLLLNFNNGYAIDSTGNNVITTVGDSRTDVLNTAPLSSSTGSLYFDGTGDYLTIPTNPNLALGSGDFTVEFWVNRLGTGLQHFLDWRTTNTQSDRLVIYYENGNVDIYLAGTPVGITRPLSQNTWNHVALVKKSNITRMFVNGISSATTYTDNNTYVEPTNGLRIGLNFTGSGPLTGYLDDIRITKGVARYTSNFPLQTYKNPTSNLLTYPTDPYRNLVVLDLNADTVNNEQNNTFLDRSGNNLTITRSGSTTQGSFSPFSPTGWSGFFNGSSFLKSTGTTIGNGDFTMELWVYLNTLGDRHFINIDNGSFTNAVLSLDSGANKFRFLIRNDGTNTGQQLDIQSSLVAQTNTWYHVCGVANGNTGTLYINGSSTLGNTGTITAGRSITGNTYRIGVNSDETSRFLNGYISNLRIVKGQALYTSNFTPLTAALTTTSTVSGVTLSAENVSLLTLQDNRFKDNSNNNLTITPNGTPSVKPFSPFQPTATYSPTVHGGSGYFNGGTSYLSIANTTSLNLASSPFLIDAWIYRMADASPTIVQVFVGKRIATTPFTISYYLGTNNTNALVFYNSGTVALSGGYIPKNQWTHISVSYDGVKGSLYVNGILVSGPNTFTITEQNVPIYIGYYPTETTSIFTGYISNLRIAKGVAITPPVGGPTAPVQAVSGTSLLLNFDNAGVVDSTGKNDVTTFNTSKVDYANLKYGSGALKFNGTNDYMQVGTASDWTFLHSPSAKWTIEFWIYNNISTSKYLLDTANDNASNAGIGIQKDASNQIRCYIARAAAPLVLDATSTPTVPLSTWTHVAITYDHSLASNNMVMYFNGLSSNVFTKTANAPVTNNPANALSIGCNGNGAGNFFNGAIDELRITNAVRYNASFVPLLSSNYLPMEN